MPRAGLSHGATCLIHSASAVPIPGAFPRGHRGRSRGRVAESRPESHKGDTGNQSASQSAQDVNEGIPPQPRVLIRLPSSVPHEFRQIGLLLGENVICLVDHHRATVGSIQIDADVTRSNHRDRIRYQGNEARESGCQPGAWCSTTTVV